MTFKERVGRRAPRWLVRAYRRAKTAAEFARDYRDYAASSAWEGGGSGSSRLRDEAEALSSRLTLAYHGIEKGAAFPSPRRPYGLSRAEDVRRLLDYARASKLELDASQYALTALEALEEFNRVGVISNEVTPVSNWTGRALDPQEIEDFISTRHSVRNFTSRKPSVDIIERIVEGAGSTPSVCNRRSYRAHYFDQDADVASILALQNGNAGFGHTVPAVFVITERRSAFVGAGERNQRWVDGGLFAMTLVWLAHAYGLGTCLLNWSQPNSQSDRLRAISGIAASEDIVVIVAIGFPAEGHRVARSPRRPIGEILVRH